MTTGIGILAAIALVQATQAPVETQMQEPPTVLDEIEVIGRQAREQVNGFIAEALAPAPGRRLARWNSAVCVGVANMDSRYAHFMIDRVSQRAAQLGLEAGEVGCTPNIFIIATDDAPALAERLVSENLFEFRPAEHGSDLGSDALVRFQQSDAAVRWWQVSLPVAIDTGQLAMRLRGDEDPPNIVVRNVSRLRANTREDLMRAIVVIDLPKVSGVSLDALADYVAMVSLVPIDPEGDTSNFDSILNLMSDGDRPRELTAWDRDFMTAYYSAAPDRSSAFQQAGFITRELVRARNSSQGDEPAQ